jgi:hypothetical protein
MRLVVPLSVMLLLVVSCGQGNSPVEKQEKQAGVEQAQRGDSEDPSDALTEQELARMSDEQTIALLECQTQKVAADLGQQEATDYVVDKIAAEITNEGTDITPVQLELWREGYTCSSEEVDTVLAGTPSSPTPTASATAEPFDESVPVAIQAEMAYCDMRQYAKKEGLSFQEVESEARTYLAEEGASWPETLEHVGVPHYIYCDMTGE